MSMEGEKGKERFYEQRFPEPEDLVVVKVTRIAEMGAYASLLEYDEMEGMILMSELSKRRFRSVNKLIKVGRQEVVMVLKVDKEKGYIDLSKKRVSHDDIGKCEDRYAKSKKVYQTVKNVAEKYKVPMGELNEKIVWPLYRKYPHALEALKEAAVNEKVLEGLDVPPEIKVHFIEDIRQRLAPSALVLRATIDVACFGYDGVDAVKSALLDGMAAANDGAEEKQEDLMKIKLIKPPEYVIVTQTFDKEEGIRRIQTALTAVEAKISTYKGGVYKMNGEIAVLGGEEERKRQEESEEESDDDEEDEDGSDESEEEDEGMGRVEDDEVEDGEKMKKSNEEDEGDDEAGKA